MNDSRRYPWLSGLCAALTVGVWLIYEAITDAMSVISGAIDAPM